MNGRFTFDVANREDIEPLCTVIVGLCMHSEGFIASGEILHAKNANAQTFVSLLESVSWSHPLSVIIAYLPDAATLPVYFTVAEFSKAVGKKEIT